MSSLQCHLGDRSSQKTTAIGDKEDLFIGVAIWCLNELWGQFPVSLLMSRSRPKLVFERLGWESELGDGIYCWLTVFAVALGVYEGRQVGFDVEACKVHSAQAGGIADQAGNPSRRGISIVASANGAISGLRKPAPVAVAAANSWNCPWCTNAVGGNCALS